MSDSSMLAANRIHRVGYTYRSFCGYLGTYLSLIMFCRFMACIHMHSTCGQQICMSPSDFGCCQCQNCTLCEDFAGAPLLLLAGFLRFHLVSKQPAQRSMTRRL